VDTNYYGSDTQSRNLRKKLAQVSCIKFPCKFMQVLVQEKHCTRNHVRRSSFLCKSTCTSFLYRFLDCVSPPLQLVAFHFIAISMCLNTRQKALAISSVSRQHNLWIRTHNNNNNNNWICIAKYVEWLQRRQLIHLSHFMIRTNFRFCIITTLDLLLLLNS